jgi:hypothetical protein
MIHKATGLYNDSTLSNVAYGWSLLIYAQFGDALSSQSQYRYYRLSCAKKTGAGTPPDAAFKPITSPSEGLSDTRVDKVSLNNESYSLGPKTIGISSGLFEVRNFSKYYWYNPDLIGNWYTWLDEADTGTYVLRLEVFDENGNKLNSASGLIDFRDGTHEPTIPPTPLPQMTDQCDLLITLDNKPPEVSMQIPAVINECGLIPGSAVPPLNVEIAVSQENGRLQSWGIGYTKGVSSGAVILDGNESNNGSLGPVVKTIDTTSAPSGADMLAGVTSTCAFALKLWALAHVRNGRYFIFYHEQIKAIAVENCPKLP